MQAQMTSNLESASANLREQLLLLATKGALAKRGEKHVVGYKEFLNLLDEVGQEENLLCRQACYLLVTTYYRPLAHSDR